jgi:CheY-like chemotaxis protein
MTTPVIRHALRGMFEAVGCVCSESENGQDGLVEALRFQPDLIVLDYSMPVMNGLEAAPLLRKVLPRTSIIMFTMFANDVFATQAVAARSRQSSLKNRPQPICSQS